MNMEMMSSSGAKSSLAWLYFFSSIDNGTLLLKVAFDSVIIMLHIKTASTGCTRLNEIKFLIWFAQIIPFSWH